MNNSIFITHVSNCVVGATPITDSTMSILIFFNKVGQITKFWCKFDMQTFVAHTVESPGPKIIQSYCLGEGVILG